MFYLAAPEATLTAEQIGFVIQLVTWVGGPSAALFMIWRGVVFWHRLVAAVEKIEGLALVVNGDGNGEYGYKEARRRLEAIGKKVNEFHEMATGEHGFYATFAAIDAKLNGWATWRHDVIDKDINRLALQIGRLEDKVEDIQKDQSLFERRKA
jgi:hypothetical protein